MKRVSPPIIVALTLLVWPLLPAAETKPAPPAAGAGAAEKSDLAGQYQGTWSSSEGATGELHIVLKSASLAEATFTFEGTSIPTQMKTVQVDGAKVRMIFSWKIQEVAGQSTLNGEWDGKVLRGAYETSTADGATRGTWTVSRR